MSKESAVNSENCFGVHGKILRIDLTSCQTSVTPVSKDHLHKYLGGKALGMSLMAEDLIDVGPLEEENKLGFFTGPLTGFLPGGCSCTAVTKSPLTDTLTDPVCQGYFGEAIKYSGYDGIIIEGKSDKPVYVYISNDQVEIVQAENLVGLSTSATEERLKSRHPNLRHAAVASVGLAGENLVRFASIIADKRAFGRGGAGAVMGSKNLKAIIAGGNCLPQVFNRTLLKENVVRLVEHVRTGNRFEVYEMFGTVGVFDKHKGLGSLSGRNYRDQETERSGLSTTDFIGQSTKKVRACSKCLVNCSRESTVKTDGADIKTNGPEFESVWALGPNINNDSPQSVAHADYLCDEYGVDTISMGAAIAFLQECVERGWTNIDPEQLNPLLLIEMVAKREGIGDILADGTKLAAKKIHPDAISITTAIKGLETPAYDPRGFYGIALAYSVSKRGGCHRKAFCSDEAEGQVSGLEIDSKPRLVVNQEIKSAWVDSLGVCKWATGGLQAGFYPDAIYATTGETISDDDLKLIGERAINLAQIFNRQQGYRRQDDILPKRFLLDKRNDSDHPIDAATLEWMKDEYYRLKGWDREGKPLAETLRTLGMENFIDLLI